MRATLQRGAVLLLLGSLAAPLSAQFDVRFADQVGQRKAVETALDLGDFTLQTLDVPRKAREQVSVPVLLGDHPVTLVLEPWSVRAASFRLLVQGADGRLRPARPAPSRTWRGRVLEVPGSRVAASLDEGRLTASILLDEHLPLWGIQPAPAGDDRRDHVVYSAEQIVDRGWECAEPVGATAAAAGSGSSFLPWPIGGGSDPDFEVCEIACDADFEFFNANGGSVAATQADIEDIINRCEIIYENAAAIQYAITAIVVRTSASDPYTSSSPSTLLSQLRIHWNANHGGIPRDVAHLFTGRNLDGTVIGIANVGVICSSSSAYGLSQSRFSGNINSRTALTAHELGHNWSALHCNGDPDCGIMCSGIGGCSGVLTAFGSAATNSILNEKNGSFCLDDAEPPAPPLVAGVSPPSVVALTPFATSMTVTGSGFLKAKEVDCAGTMLTLPAFTIVDDSTITFPAPPAPALGPATVTVSNQGGPSNAATFDYVATEPPIFMAPLDIYVDPVDTGAATWRYATTPGDLAFFLIDLDGATLPFKGYQLLASPYPIVRLNNLNAAGVGQLTIPILPEYAPAGLFYTVYTQMAFIGPGGIRTISNVASTVVLE